MKAKTIENQYKLTQKSYYPFGMQMPGRAFSTNSYRYSYNTQEKTPELHQNHTTAKYWEYDSRVVHRWNTDPITTPWQSPYSINHGNPIINSDPFGDYGGKRKSKKFAKQKEKEGYNVNRYKDDNGQWQVKWNNINDNQTISGNITDGYTIPEVITGTKTFGKPGKFNLYNSMTRAIYTFDRNHEMVANVRIKVKIGVAAGVKAQYNGTHAKGNLSLMNVTMFDGKLDIPKLAEKEEDLFTNLDYLSVDYIGDGDGTRISQSASLTLGAAGYDILGGSIVNSFNGYSYGYDDHKVSGNIYLISPLLQNPDAEKVNQNIVEGEAKVMSPLKVKSNKLNGNVDKNGNKKATIKGGVGAQLIIGADILFEVGFKNRE